MAMWIEFTGPWDHRVHPSRVIAYTSGYRGNFPEDVARAAIAAGKAREIDHPNDLKSTKTRHGGVRRVDQAKTKEK